MEVKYALNDSIDICGKNMCFVYERVDMLPFNSNCLLNGPDNAK